MLHPAYRAVGLVGGYGACSLGPVLSACYCCEVVCDMKHPHKRCCECERGPRFFGRRLFVQCCRGNVAGLAPIDARVSRRLRHVRALGVTDALYVDPLFPACNWNTTGTSFLGSSFVLLHFFDT